MSTLCSPVSLKELKCPQISTLEILCFSSHIAASLFHIFLHIKVTLVSCSPHVNVSWNVTLKLYSQAEAEKSTVNTSRVKFCVGSKIGRIFHVWMDASWVKGERRATSHHLIYSDSLCLHHIPEKQNDGYYIRFNKQTLLNPALFL